MSTDAPLFESWFGARHPDIRMASARAVLELAGEGATVPFIARYRKEKTGNLDEVQIQKAISAKERWDRIVARQAAILEAIERQKKLTPELEQKIRAAFDLDLLEDLYLPYKQKKKSKANVAREAGLEPLADWIWNCAHGTDTPQPGQTLDLWAFTFRNPEKGIGDAQAAIRGAEDILVERLAEMADLRTGVRAAYWDKGFLSTGKTDKAKPNSKYENYFAHHEKIAGLRDPAHSHRYLAMRRGVAEGELHWSLGGAPGDEGFDEALLRTFELAACAVPDSPGADLLLRVARRSLKEHVVPSIANELHRDLKEASDDAAIRVFAENVRRVLLAPPFGPKPVLAVDPGLRTGCKLAVVDASGAYVASEVLHLLTDEGKVKGKERLFALVRESSAQAVAVGNGTAGRETETFVRESLKEQGVEAPVVLVSEAGASVYSASEIAREEFPDLDVTVRGAISIARRLQDPLAELVKIEPKSIGVGQYQHDVSGRALERSLEHVVDSCVNQVGVNLNTASAPLLAHVSGIGPALAKAVVQHRQEKGLFESRAALLEVARFSAKTFEQAAGFLRVPAASHPLDNTGVHPERYALLEGLAATLGKPVGELLGPGAEQVRQASALREEVGAFTFDDIVKELEKPGRDPRESFVPFAFREDVHQLADLKPGMVCPGIVTNVTNFGAFVDIGVHQDGLVHISQMGDRFVKDPRGAVNPGDRVQVRVLKVDLAKKQISLTMKTSASREGRPPKDRGKRPPRRGPAGAAKPTAPREPRPAGRGKPPASRPAPSRPPAPPAGASAPVRPLRPAGESKERPASGARRNAPPAADRGARRPSPAEAPRAKAPAFNNPFAVLANLKDDKKKE
jgi:protein Tex